MFKLSDTKSSKTSAFLDKSCCFMGILISSLYPNVALANGLYVWVLILTMQSSKIGLSSILKMSVIF